MRSTSRVVRVRESLAASASPWLAPDFLDAAAASVTGAPQGGQPGSARGTRLDAANSVSKRARWGRQGKRCARGLHGRSLLKRGHEGGGGRGDELLMKRRALAVRPLGSFTYPTYRWRHVYTRELRSLDQVVI